MSINAIKIHDMYIFCDIFSFESVAYHSGIIEYIDSWWLETLKRNFNNHFSCMSLINSFAAQWRSYVVTGKYYPLLQQKIDLHNVIHTPSGVLIKKDFHFSEYS